VCKHVRVLERAGLVRRTRYRQENTLELQAAPLREVARWVLNCAGFWAARLEEFFASNQRKESK